jgi:hypothetical protein
MGAKPDDSFVVSLCWRCHARLHIIGEATFQKTLGIDLLALAAEFVAKSPHRSKFK